MALFDAALNVGATAIAAAATHAQLHSGNPGGSGTSNVATSGRQSIPWGSASGSGDIGITEAIHFTGGANGGAIEYVSLWSQSSGGTCYGFFAASGDDSFNSTGEADVTALSLDGSST